MKLYHYDSKLSIPTETIYSVNQGRQSDFDTVAGCQWPVAGKRMKLRREYRAPYRFSMLRSLCHPCRMQTLYYTLFIKPYKKRPTGTSNNRQSFLATSLLIARFPLSISDIFCLLNFPNFLPSSSWVSSAFSR